MSRTKTHQARILAVVSSSKGFGFALLEGETLVNWGVKTTEGNKSVQAFAKFRALVAHYQPSLVVLQDALTGGRRSVRVTQLIVRMATSAQEQGLRTKLISQEVISDFLLKRKDGTKHEIAMVVAQQFPEELLARLPPKRRAWESEDYRLPIFMAVALAVVASGRLPKRPKSSPR